MVAGLSFAVSGQNASTTTASATNSQVDEQSPSYVGSIVAPRNATDAQLAKRAIITADAAKTAALSDPTVTGGTVKEVSLDDENGYVVYSVEIVKGSTTYDVKVDAGNPHVLYIDQGNEDSATPETPGEVNGAEKQDQMHEGPEAAVESGAED